MRENVGAVQWPDRADNRLRPITDPVRTTQGPTSHSHPEATPDGPEAARLHAGGGDAQLGDRGSSHRVDTFIAALQAASLTAAESSNLDAALQGCLGRLCRLMDWPLGHVYLADEEHPGELVSHRLWHVEDPERFAPLIRAAERTHFHAGEGLPGEVLRTGTACWVVDVENDPHFTRVEAARASGIRTAFAFPIPVAGETAAVLALFATERVEPDTMLLEVMSHIGAHLGQVIQRQRAETARVQAELHLRSVAESATDAIISTDRGGQVASWNEGAARMFGFSAAEIIAKPLTLLMPERFHQAHRDGLDRLAAGGQPRIIGQTVELFGVRKGGAEFPIELSLATWQVEGEAYFSGIIRDISERRRIEAELERHRSGLEELVEQRTTALAATSRELEAFAYSVSHDLRAPLRSIDGFSQIILEDYADRLDEKGRGHLDRVRAASQRMGRLIDDLLGLSRVTRREVRPTRIDLSKIAEETVAELRAGDPERDVIVEVQRGLRDRADEGLMRVVLGNLLGNAWKFTARHDRARIEFGARPEGSGRAYFVRDDGAGFDPAYTDKLFGAFQRLHATGEFQGSGIGLATVERIVQRHGGRVWAEGVVEQGATFYFTLSTRGQPTSD